LLKSAYLSFFSKPRHERAVYRAIRELQAGSIVELGVGLGTRARRMIATAARYHDAAEIRYAGIDLFEARPQAGSSLPLKQAHQMLRAAGAQVRLIPGDPLSALSRAANSLQSTDLIVVAADQDLRSLEQAWFYVPRMMHERSLLLVESAARNGILNYQRLTEADATQLAARTASVRRAA